MTFENKNEIAQALRRHRIQPTSQRVEIAHVLFDAGCERDHHLSADEVLERVNADYHRVSKATVYNTLRLFEETGLIRAVVVSSSKVFFDPNTDPHHHLYDEASGTLRDIPAEEIDVEKLMPQMPEGVAGEDLDIVVRVRNQG
ncbi:MAG TPA: Fur family transcriptional regulator [Gammaproteobacteria bacterium]|jgi:Fur family iron response transcriptional regulator|nr:Fur family transcriptional regulator [Gammaproteobacteria bacterium]